jgi:hypothetical protein
VRSASHERHQLPFGELAQRRVQRLLLGCPARHVRGSRSPAARAGRPAATARRPSRRTLRPRSRSSPPVEKRVADEAGSGGQRLDRRAGAPGAGLHRPGEQVRYREAVGERVMDLADDRDPSASEPGDDRELPRGQPEVEGHSGDLRDHRVERACTSRGLHPHAADMEVRARWREAFGDPPEDLVALGRALAARVRRLLDDPPPPRAAVKAATRWTVYRPGEEPRVRTRAA